MRLTSLLAGAVMLARMPSDTGGSSSTGTASPFNAVMDLLVNDVASPNLTQSGILPLGVVDGDGTTPTLTQIGGGAFATATVFANSGPSAETAPFGVSATSIAGAGAGSTVLEINSDAGVQGTLTINVTQTTPQSLTAGEPILGAIGEPPVFSF
jgi:hypothetical protein